MRIFATLIALALAVFPLNAALAAPSRDGGGCPHRAAAVMVDYTMAGHRQHQPAKSPASPLVCCILHGVAFASDPAEPGPDAPEGTSLLWRTEVRFEGTDIEPAIPPPRL